MCFRFLREMNYIRRYLIAHFSMLRLIYNSFMFKKDKKFFALLFNLKSFLNKKPLRVKWNENHFITLDKNFPDIKYTFRNVIQGNMTYKYGLQARADGLARAYFLDQKNIQYITAYLGPERCEYTLASMTNKLLSNGFKIVDAISDRIAVLYENENYIHHK